MSLRIKKIMGTRSDASVRNFKKKYIFVFEGEKTEKKYFEEMSNNKQELGITDLIHIEILERNDESKSNQLDVVKSLDEYINEIVSMQQSNEEIKLKLKEIIFSKLNDKDIQIKDRLLFLIEKCFTAESNCDAIDDFIEGVNIILIEDAELEYFIQEIKSLKSSLDYDNEIDEVCIIIDRDKGSFKTVQYDEVISICKENNYNLGITNPCFEFWLLLHLTDCSEYDSEDIRINRKISKSRNSKRFVEKELANILGGYNKSNLKFEEFKDKISIAIKNAKLYEDDLLNLENSIGSRVANIIEKMINEN
ncbi:RloB family protein [Romboutsia sp.]|uniref:RloB family protein n=1 Tax=Romboutsia sp. TaxID=1965302 RepID=UPI003F356D91